MAEAATLPGQFDVLGGSMVVAEPSDASVERPEQLSVFGLRPAVSVAGELLQGGAVADMLAPAVGQERSANLERVRPGSSTGSATLTSERTRIILS